MNLRALIILAVVLGLILVLLAVLFFFTARTTEVAIPSGGAVIEHYVCDDDSFYMVAREEGAISVAGVRYDAVSGTRYEHEGSLLAFTLSQGVLSVEDTTTGGVVNRCEVGARPATVPSNSEEGGVAE